MQGTIRSWAAVALLGLGTLGCSTTREARYVYQDGQCGVVGIPQNSSRWPHYYRDQAEKLMAEHFPDGFEIIRAEEVVEGSRTLTVGGTSSAEITPGLPTDLIKVGKLGRTSVRSQADTLKIKECRIIYKKADPQKADLAVAGEYAAQPTYTPTLYVDPNETERRHLVAKPVAPDKEKKEGEAAVAAKDQQKVKDAPAS